MRDMVTILQTVNKNIILIGEEVSHFRGLIRETRNAYLRKCFIVPVLLIPMLSKLSSSNCFPVGLGQNKSKLWGENRYIYY